MSDLVERLHEAYHTACKLEDGEYLPASMVEAMIDAKVEIERLRAVVQLGVEMRARQKAYFKSRDRGDLIASKEAESSFDKAAQP